MARLLPQCSNQGLGGRLSRPAHLSRGRVSRMQFSTTLGAHGGWHYREWARCWARGRGGEAHPVLGILSFAPRGPLPLRQTCLHTSDGRPPADRVVVANVLFRIHAAQDANVMATHALREERFRTRTRLRHLELRLSIVHGGLGLSSHGGLGLSSRTLGRGGS